MKRILVLLFFLVPALSCGFCSELSLSGTAPTGGTAEMGLGVSLGTDAQGSISSDNMGVEFFYRKSVVESLDWGVGIAPMDTSAFPGTPDITFDLKAQLIKGTGMIPSFVLGVNMVRLSNFDFANPEFSPVFLDAGRIGLSWEFYSCRSYVEGRGCVEVRKNYFYLGANLIPGASDISSRMFAGIIYGKFNLIVVMDDGLDTVGLAYRF